MTKANALEVDSLVSYRRDLGTQMATADANN
jgi:hypothetical protein